MNTPENLTGIILSGGKSSRFGQDKAMASFGKTTFIENAIRIVKPLASDLIISTNHPKHKQFGYKTVADEIKNIGPLGGILSGLKASVTKYNIILSVDMPLMNTSYIQFLLEKSENALITIGMDTKNKQHPMCGIFNQQALPYIEANIIKKRYSLHYLIETSPHHLIVPPPTKAFFYSDKIFHNINTPGDYIDYICSGDNPTS